MLSALFPGNAPVRVQPFFGYRNDRTLVVSARALRRREPVFDTRGFWGGLGTMIRQYASHEVPGLDVHLEFETGAGELIRQSATTENEGFARFEIPFAESYPLPLDTGWERATLRWQADDAEAPLEKTAFILAPGRSAGVGVISDIDDTILETGITGSFRAIARNWRRVMAQMPGERIVVPGAPDFFAALGGSAPLRDASRVPQPVPRPIFYVSSSPWNLFSYLVTFKHQRELPLGPIMLRDWGLNRRTLGSEGHGSHKQAAVERILAAYPHMRFVLVGDDTQKDLSVFGSIAASRPDRIAAVFIRQSAGRSLGGADVSAKSGMAAAGVPFWMGSDYAEARAFLAEAGLDFDTGTDELVRVASGEVS